MRPADQGSFLNRISIRRNQVVSMDGNNELDLEELELFQKHVADRFSDLLPPPSSSSSSPGCSSSDDTLLSIAWFRKLLDSFLCCEAEFKAVLIMGRDPTQITKPPLDRLIPELLDRSLKALDICNAITHGIDLVRQWQKLARIAVAALQQRPIGEGQVRRAKRALNTLLTSMALDDKENHHGKSTERSWSFGRRGTGGAASTNRDRTAGFNFRSLSWSVAKSWSASKQIHAMSVNLVAPRGSEPASFAVPVYMMSTVLVFVMWALVAAVPCQERAGLSTHLPVPKQMAWALSITGLHEKIGEEWKKKEKRGTCGLLEEVERMEKVSQSLVEFADSFQFPVESDEVVEAPVAELADICSKMEDGLIPLQQQVREVFQRIVRSRGEILDLLGQTGKLSAPVPY